MTDLEVVEGATEEQPKRRMPTQAFGLALITAAFAVILVGFLLFTDGSDAGFGAALLVVGALATWMLWRVIRLWAVIVGLVITVAAAMAFYIAFGIFQPFSPVEFISGLLYVLGFFFALVGGIRALSKRRREAGVGKSGMRIRKMALGLVGVLAVVSVVGFSIARTTVSAAEAADAAALDMANFEFAPTTPSVTAGQNLLLTNSDGFVHDFTIDELDVYVNFVPGSEAIVDLRDVPAGIYQFYCSLHSDGVTGMAGTLTIEG